MMSLRAMTGFLRNSKPLPILRYSRRLRFSRLWPFWKRKKSKELLRHWRVSRKRTKLQWVGWPPTSLSSISSKITTLRLKNMLTSLWITTDTMLKPWSTKVTVSSWKTISAKPRNSIYKLSASRLIALRHSITWDTSTRSWTFSLKHCR